MVIRRRDGIVVFFIVAFMLRAAIAYRGGIWADEGFFLSIITLPSWGGMISFLQAHESHPPFFYALMRLWISIVGNSDATTLLFAVLLGASIVPVTYLVTKALYSTRAAVVAGFLVAVSSGLAEYSAQIRPYGLLPILVLLSCASMVRLLDQGSVGRAAAYALFTTLLVYTHNWSWLVVAGQGVAAILILARMQSDSRTQISVLVIGSWLAIGVAFLPWLPSFVFQVRHAGHQPIALPTLIDKLGAFVFALLVGPQMMLLGSLPQNLMEAIAISSAVALVVAFAVAWFPIHRSTLPLDDSVELPPRTKRSAIATRVFLVVPAVCLIMGGLTASRTNLLIGWCLAMLSPLVLVVFGAWVERNWPSVHLERNLAPAAAASMVLLVIMFAFCVRSVLGAPRSNSREVAAALIRDVRSDDVVIVAPEWYAPAFNHYFPKLVEQIDFPYTGRAPTIDFSNVAQRTLDSRPLIRLLQQIADARVANRRVWLVTGPKHIRHLNSKEDEQAHQPGYTSLTLISRIGRIRNALIANYGTPDRSHSPPGPPSRYNDVLLELYAPPR